MEKLTFFISLDHIELSIPLLSILLPLVVLNFSPNKPGNI